jgi:hypothetical protein
MRYSLFLSKGMQHANTFPMRFVALATLATLATLVTLVSFVSFVSLVSLVSVVSLCQLVHKRGDVRGTSPIPETVP